MNLKHKCKNLKHGREKQVTHMSSYLNQLGSLKQRSLTGETGAAQLGSVSSCKLAMCLFQIAIFEMDASAIKA